MMGGKKNHEEREQSKKLILAVEDHHVPVLKRPEPEEDPEGLKAREKSEQEQHRMGECE